MVQKGAVLVASLAACAAKSGNMNGKYMVASGKDQGVPYNDDYASKGHEYFDIYSPEIATHYAEVFWTNMGNQPLPDEIVQRFKGKTIAITGYEEDQVMVSPVGQHGVNPAADVSVPFTWAYNHHYEAYILGSHSELRMVPCKPGDMHCVDEHLVAFDLPSAADRADPTIPTSQFFSEGNGGESRKSYHGYPNGYAQLVDSPTTFQVEPMQIDTRNRECGVRPDDVLNCTDKFRPGPEPKQARYGRGIPEDTSNSGIIECPCNEGYGGDTIWYPEAETKIVTHNYALRATGSCDDQVASADTCFAVAQSLGLNVTAFSNKTVSDAKLPPACSIKVLPDGSANVYFNDAGEATCDGGRMVGTTESSVNVSLTLELDASKGGSLQRSDPGEYCRDKHDFMQQFSLNQTVTNRTPALMDTRDRCEEFCLLNDDCWGCSVDCANVDELICNWNALKTCGGRKKWSGALPGDVSEKKLGLANITMKGPADAWFGIGFNAHSMMDQPYVIIANDTGVMEKKIGQCTDEGKHCDGPLLENSITVVSNTVEAGERTVVMIRAMQGLTKDHFSFDPAVITIPLITAIGQSNSFAYHKSHALATISLANQGAPSCVCDLGISGKICETGGDNCNEFGKGRCAEDGPLTAQKNPTCTSAQYAGGLICCQHKRIMLDLDQQKASLAGPLLRYHMKYRFWFQEYVPAAENNGVPSHYNLDRVYYQTEAHATEYDVPPAFALSNLPIPGYPKWPAGKMTPGTSCTGSCPDGDDCECEHTITYEWTVPGTRLFYAGGHCHAPSCLSLNLYINKSGELELLCAQVPVYGKGNVSHDKFDDKGYITLPPCLWSDDPSEALNPTTWLPEGTRLVSIKKNRNTHYGHYGEMASWQMRGVHFEHPPATEASLTV